MQPANARKNTSPEFKRREALLFALNGLGAVALPVVAIAASGAARSTGQDFQKMAVAPKTPAEHRDLARHYRTLAAERRAESRHYQGLAAAYRQGYSGELARGMEQAAAHSRDFAEALERLAEAHEGYAGARG